MLRWRDGRAIGRITGITVATPLPAAVATRAQRAQRVPLPPIAYLPSVVKPEPVAALTPAVAVALPSRPERVVQPLARQISRTAKRPTVRPELTVLPLPGRRILQRGRRYAPDGRPL